MDKGRERGSEEGKGEPFSDGWLDHISQHYS